jgi:polyisoprenoid-binding protein YceI
MYFLPLTLALLALAGLNTAHGQEIHQVLSHRGSRISFGVESPNPSLNMSGSLSDYSGVFTLNTSDLTRSRLELTVSLSSIKLPPNQTLQAILLQSIVARVSPTPRTFRSSRIERVSGSNYLLHGSYNWLSKNENVVVPITIESAAPQATTISLLVNGDFKKRAVPANLQGLAEGAAGSNGWTKARLVFNLKRAVKEDENGADG